MVTEATFLPTNAMRDVDFAGFKNNIVASDASVFERPHCAGYWLYGVEWDMDRGWLAYEFDERTFDPNTHKFDKAIAAWRAGRALPAGYFRLDHHFAFRAYNLGCRKWGWCWFAEKDLSDVDNIVQFALLGEIRYG